MRKKRLVPRTPELEMSPLQESEEPTSNEPSFPEPDDAQGGYRALSSLVGDWQRAIQSVVVHGDRNFMSLIWDQLCLQGVPGQEWVGVELKSGPFSAGKPWGGGRTPLAELIIPRYSATEDQTPPPKKNIR